ncbi:MAG: pyridoxal-phosphate-dependent aminotransferase family protein [Candidatus Hodarchaeales archaeon]|jgi:aspartate aminotransferase-like enzyme
MSDIYVQSYGNNSNSEIDLFMLPGPVRLHPRIKRAMSQPIIGHRTVAFRKYYLETVDMFKKYLKISETQHDLFLLAGSGSIALEAAIANFIDQSTETKVAAFVNGKFSDRAAQIAKSFGASVIRVEVKWGDPITPDLVDETLQKNPGVSFVTVCHNETTTGVLQPIKEIGKVVHRHDALLIADCITSVAGLYVCPEEQLIDVLASGSQKSWGLPPGLAMITISPRAWKKMPDLRHTFYVDLKAYQKKHSSGDAPWTPAISLIFGLHESLSMMLEETELKRSRRHAWCAELIRTGIQALNWKLLAKEGYYSPVVTAIRVPDEISVNELRKEMNEMGIQIAGAQDQLKTHHIRIASMNTVRERDILATFAILELALAKLGYKIEFGVTIKAIQEKITSINL